MSPQEIDFRTSQGKRRQFDLLTLFEWTLLVGLFFAVLSTGNDIVFTYEFSNLPPDDRALERWYADEAGLKSATIERDQDEVMIRTRQSMLFWSVDTPQPPWESLGYVGLKSHEFEYRASVFKAPLIIGFALVFCVSLFRKFQTRHSGGK